MKKHVFNQRKQYSIKLLKWRYHHTFKINFTMIKIKQFLIISFFCFYYTTPNAYSQKATNPLIFADVPDMSIIRVNDNYYMSSTTMHMCP